MKLLAIDTSTEACSCTLSIEGIAHTRAVIAPRQHAALILPMIAELLQLADLKPTQLDGLAFVCGPGSFTGVRITAGVAQGIAFAADIPVVPISSLATLAQAAHIEYGVEQVLAAIDARMSEVYWGRYLIDAYGIMRCNGEESVCAPDNISIPTTGTWHGTGSGWATYSAKLAPLIGNMLYHYHGDKYPQSHAMIPLALAAFQEGKAVSAEQALPVYVRNKVVQTTT